jgi:hypothetical protein
LIRNEKHFFGLQFESKKGKKVWKKRDLDPN